MPRLPTALLALTLLAPLAAAEVRRVPQDHPTIQAAVDAASPGDTVLVGPGVYREFVQVFDKDDLTIRGVGKAILFGEDVVAEELGFDEQFGILAEDCERLTVRGLRFEDYDEGVSTDDCDGLEVSDCRMTGGSSGVTVLNALGARVHDVRVQETSIGVVISNGFMVGVEDVDVRQASSRAVSITQSVGVQLLGLDVRDSLRGVVLLGGSTRGIEIAACRFTDIAQDAVACGASSVTVRDSWFRNVGRAVDAGSSGDELVAVVGNRIQDTDGDAVVIGSKASRVVGNAIRRAGRDGIQITTQGQVVARNRISNSGRHGVALLVSINTVFDNRVRKSGNQDVFDPTGDNFLLSQD